MGTALDRSGGPVAVDAEDEQVREAESRAFRGQGGLPVRLEAEVARGVSAQQSNQDFRHDATADRAEPVAAAAVLGLLQRVVPQWSAVGPPGCRGGVSSA